MLAWQAADRAAENLRNQLKAIGRPQDPYSAAALLNIDVFPRTDMPAGSSGMIIKRAGEDRARVYINAKDTPQRQRFTLAHEIGHYFERMVEAQDREFSFSDNRSTAGADYNLHEFYADQFAGSFLMPASEVRALTPDLTNAVALAARFGVSIPAAQMRLKRLQIQDDFEGSQSA